LKCQLIVNKKHFKVILNNFQLKNTQFSLVPGLHSQRSDNSPNKLSALRPLFSRRSQNQHHLTGERQIWHLSLVSFLASYVSFREFGQLWLILKSRATLWPKKSDLAAMQKSTKPTKRWDDFTNQQFLLRRFPVFVRLYSGVKHPKFPDWGQSSCCCKVRGKGQAVTNNYSKFAHWDWFTEENEASKHRRDDWFSVGW
jgi:hypothetical protein